MKLRLTAFAGKPNDEQWNTNFQLLKAYVEEHKAYPSTDSDGLGIWLSNQRRAYNKKTLSKDRILRLKSLDDWSWDVLTDLWDKNFKELQTYLKGNNNKYPGEKSSSRKERILGSWLNNQRQAYKKKDLYPDRITQERIDLLNSLPGWSWDPSTDKWNKNFQRLQAYVKKHRAYPTRPGSLGTWVGNQRDAYKKKTLSTDRILRLKSLDDWSWDVLTDLWDKNFKELETYLTNNEGKYPGQHDGDLGVWLSNQRKAYKKKDLYPDRITPDRILRLESLDDWSWDPFTAQWNKNFEKWKKYIVEHNGRPNRGPLQGWAIKIRAIGAETYKTRYPDRYDKLMNYVTPEFKNSVKSKNIPKESLEWTWKVNKMPPNFVAGKESEKIIFDLFTDDGIFKNSTRYNTPRTGCDFFRYENETLTFFEIKTTSLFDDQKNAIPNFDLLTKFQEKLRDLISDRSSLFEEALAKLKKVKKDSLAEAEAVLELEGVKKDFLAEAFEAGLDLESLLDPETGTHKDYESLKYCVIFCSFFEDPKDSGKYQIKFPATGYYEDSNIQRPHGLDEHILEVPLETLDIIKKNQRVTAKLRIGRWIKQ